jgi:hypothetical protein
MPADRVPLNFSCRIRLGTRGPRLLGRARRTVATQAFGAHAIAQNAHHQTDADIPDRHTALNPRALAVQADAADRFL